MRKKLLPLFLLATTFGFSQVTVFEDNFDSYNDFIITGIGNWQTLDLDQLNTYTGGTPQGVNPNWANAGAPMAYQIFNPSNANVSNATSGEEVRNFDPRSGAKYAACWAGSPNSNGQTATANNDWLISPPINLTGFTGSSLSVWVKSMSNTYGLEKYRIGVYVGSGDPTSASDFTIISGGSDLTAPYPNWVERVQSLSAYDGQTIRVGIQCKTPDAYMFMVDDFKVTANSLSSENFLASKFNVSPNPAQDEVRISRGADLEISNVKISDINGRIVKTIDGNVEVISLTDLTSGVYMMTIQSSSGIATKKLVKN